MRVRELGEDPAPNLNHRDLRPELWKSNLCDDEDDVVEGDEEEGAGPDGEEEEEGGEGSGKQSVTFRFQNFSVSKLFHFCSYFRFGNDKNWC